jgi:hypothetical protein
MRRRDFITLVGGAAVAFAALLAVITAEAFSSTASACTGTYAGYSCSQWNQIRDG